MRQDLIPFNGRLNITFEFKKTQKILDRSEFLLLSEKGKKFQDHFFVVLCLPGKYPWPRLGITVSKRIGNAVKRNRIKRVVREWFRLRRSAFSGNWDINIIAKKSAACVTGDQVFHSLEKLADKIGGFKIKYLVLLCIRLYQVLLSPVLGPSCRFYPSCSAYAMEAIHRYGVFRGGILSVKRILRCHPFHPGGVDPVP